MYIRVHVMQWLECVVAEVSVNDIGHSCDIIMILATAVMSSPERDVYTATTCTCCTHLLIYTCCYRICFVLLISPFSLNK